MLKHGVVAMSVLLCSTALSGVALADDESRHQACLRNVNSEEGRRACDNLYTSRPEPVRKVVEEKAESREDRCRKQAENPNATSIDIDCEGYQGVRSGFPGGSASPPTSRSGSELDPRSESTSISREKSDAERHNEQIFRETQQNLRQGQRDLRDIDRKAERAKREIDDLGRTSTENWQYNIDRTRERRIKKRTARENTPV